VNVTEGQNYKTIKYLHNSFNFLDCGVVLLEDAETLKNKGVSQKVGLAIYRKDVFPKPPTRQQLIGNIS